MTGGEKWRAVAGDPEEWIVTAAVFGCLLAVGLPIAALTFLIGRALTELTVSRSLVVDWGRWSAGVWPLLGSRCLLSVRIVRRGVAQERAGLQVLIGRTMVLVFALYGRKEWAARRRGGRG